MIPDPQAPCPWDTSPSCVLKRRISRWVSVGLLETVKWTWNDMDFPLNVAATKFGDRFFLYFFDHPILLGDVTMATFFVFQMNQIWDH